MHKIVRNVVALVSSDDTPSGLRAALEHEGYEVPVVYARDLRGATTTFSTFVETYKPEIVVIDLHSPASDAVKDILSFKSVRSAESTAFVLACSDGVTHAKLPEQMGAIDISGDDGTGVVLRAVAAAITKKRAA